MTLLVVSGQSLALDGLPAALEAALAQHLLPATDSCAKADLLISAKKAPPATTCIEIDLHKPQRLGRLLADIARALGDSALYTAPFMVGDFLFDPALRSLVRDGQEITLTERENKLLLHLARLGGAGIGREELLRDVWAYQEGVDTHTIETHIYRLRQKIEDNAENPVLLRTTPTGYILQGVGSAAD